MAMIKISEDNKKGTRQIEISNGDLEALNEVVESWGFKDIESALRFGLAALAIAKKKALYYENDRGEKIMLEPTDILKKDLNEPKK